MEEVRPGRLHLKDGSSLRFGLCIWSTGVGPTPFIESLPFAKTSVGRLAVNKQMQVLLKDGQARRPPPTPTPSTLLVPVIGSTCGAFQYAPD